MIRILLALLPRLRQTQKRFHGCSTNHAARMSKTSQIHEAVGLRQLLLFAPTTESHEYRSFCENERTFVREVKESH